MLAGDDETTRPKARNGVAVKPWPGKVGEAWRIVYQPDNPNNRTCISERLSMKCVSSARYIHVIADGVTSLNIAMVLIGYLKPEISKEVERGFQYDLPRLRKLPPTQPTAAHRARMRMEPV